MLIDLTIAVPPRMKPRLKILDPTTLPIEISVWPVIAARIVTANSGADVPNATTVSPITRSEILSEWAISDAASTNQSAPFQSISIDNETKTRSKIKFNGLPLKNYIKIAYYNLLILIVITFILNFSILFYPFSIKNI